MVEQPARDRARERGLAVHDAVEELGDPLRRLGLQQVAGRAGADRGEQVVLGAGRGEHDDLAPGRRRRGGAAARSGRRCRASRGRAGRRRAGAAPASDRLLRRPAASPHTSKPCAPSSDASASRVSGWSSTIRTRGHRRLIGRDGSADKGEVKDGRTTSRPGSSSEIAARRPARRQPRALPHAPGPPDAVRPAASCGSCSRRRWPSPACSSPFSPPPASRPRGGASTSCSRAASSSASPLVGRLRDRPACSAAPTLRPPEAWAALARRHARQRRSIAVAPFVRGRTTPARLGDRERGRRRGPRALRRVVAPARRRARRCRR